MKSFSQGSKNIREGVLTHISTNLSDRLGFDSWPYPKSFMSLMQMKDYTYMVTEDGKVL